MSAASDSATSSRTGFFRQWGWFIVGIVIAGAVFVGWRQYLNHIEGMPITEPFAAELRELESKSPRAKAYLADFYSFKQRAYVSGAEYLAVCEEMRRLAEMDGVALQALPGEPHKSVCAFPGERS